MNANDSLERGIADVYEREAPPRAPDWVLGSVLDVIDTTPQRRVLIPAPWRFRHMNTFAKAAIAAVVVIAVGALGLSVLGPRSSSGVGGQPSASPSVSPSPSTSPDASPPPLSQTFTSERHGFSMSYPAGWDSTRATAPSTTAFPQFGAPDGDFLFDPAFGDHLFIGAASRPLEGEDATRWPTDTLTALAAEGECQLPSVPVTIDGTAGQLCGSVAATSAGDRGYVFALYASGDDPLAAFDDAFFRRVLATIQLTPETADDTVAGATPSPSS